MSQMENSFDFIVVGAGPAGAVLATRLANSPASPSVLLIEAGGTDANAPLQQRMTSTRSTTYMNYPLLNWGYKTTPQSGLNNRIIDYSRGKGLGGSSLINYTFWTIPPAADYDRWAKLVDDDSFGWKRMQARLKKLERLRPNADGPIREFFNPSEQNHGMTGNIDVEAPSVIEPEILSFLIEMKRQGGQMNTDLNSGDPIGLGFLTATSRRGIRTTARSAFLENLPNNLVVRTDSPADRIVVQDKVAVGVESGGAVFSASKEVVLCAGALDSPKLLMLSGIGEASEMERHGIPLVVDLPGVGENLQDHVLLQTLYQRKDPSSQPYDAWGDEEAAGIALRQLEEDGTGPFAVNGMGFILGFLKDEKTLSSPKFKALPPSIQQHLEHREVPTYETAWGLMSPRPGMDPKKSYLAVPIILQYPQSVGHVRLASADSRAPPICDPALLSHPFDRMSMVNAVKATMKIPGNPLATGDVEYPLIAPAGDSDEEVWSFIEEHAMSCWHPSCTVKMGTNDDEDACVDTDFRVRGVRNLRVADMSVTPFLPSTHTVSTAYLIGETAAEKLIAQYALNLPEKS